MTADHLPSPLASLSALLRESETRIAHRVITRARERGFGPYVPSLEAAWLASVRAYVYDEELGMLAIAADCESPFVAVTREDSLAVTLERMATAHYQQLPVVDHPGGQLVGLISYDDLLQAYSSELQTRRSGLASSTLSAS